MVKFDHDSVYCFDVDDTLVMHTPNSHDHIGISCPYIDKTIWVHPHYRHMQLLMQMHGRGRLIVVWSQGGAAWAEAVVKALGLDSYVHLVMGKPHGYVDDLPVTEFMKNRIYLKEGQE